jgi:hypothetical protein
MKLGTETGSMSNYLMSGTKGAPTPEVGMGATVLMWTDRHPATIISVVKFKGGARAGQVKEVHIQQDNATRKDANGMSECQSYEFTRNTDAPVRSFKVNKRGAFMDGGTQLRIGERDKYHDFSF